MIKYKIWTQLIKLFKKMKIDVDKLYKYFQLIYTINKVIII